MLYWRPNSNNTLILDYSTSLTRPAVNQLNPFVDESNNHSVSHGNPDLKAQYMHDVTLTWYFTKIKNLTFVGNLSYNHFSDLILPYRYSKDSKMYYTYNNFGAANQYQFSFNADWRPNAWLSMSVNGAIGKRYLRSADAGLHQDNPSFPAVPAPVWAAMRTRWTAKRAKPRAQSSSKWTMSARSMKSCTSCAKTATFRASAPPAIGQGAPATASCRWRKPVKSATSASRTR